VIRHVVLMRFADPNDATEVRRRLLALPADIPQILSMDVGLDVLRTEASYDLALETTHESLDALKAYQAHPVHQAFLQWLRPRLRDRVVVDAEV
jgi:hypothetical protein